MVKRCNRQSQEEELIRRLETEHDLFYYRMISESSRAVYEKCAKIRFYEIIYEYFLYCENIENKHIEACLLAEQILSELYDIYLKYEDLRVDTWEDVKDLLDRYMESMDARMVKVYRQFGMPQESTTEGGVVVNER